MLKKTRTIARLLLGVFAFSLLPMPETVWSDALDRLNVIEPQVMEDEKERENHIVIQMSEGSDLTEITSLFPEQALVEVFHNNGSISVDFASIRDVEVLLDAENLDLTIETIYEDETAYLHKVPYDPYYGSYQWNLKRISMEDAWDFPLTEEDVVVAVIDTGVTAYNDLYGLMNGADFSTGVLREDSFPGQYSYDGGNHGTAVASVIAAQHNDIAIAGINPKAKIMGVKVFPDGSDTTSMNMVSSGIRWATDHGADIINLSLGSLNGTSALREAVDYAYAQGVSVIASTGNDGYQNAIRYPAAYERVMAVGSTNDVDEISFFSNEGVEIDLVAPGEGILLPDIKSAGSYSGFSGTSFSAPTVSGVAALVLDAYPGISPSMLKKILERSARDLGIEGWDASSGHGILDAKKAMETAEYSAWMDDNDHKGNAERIHANKAYAGYMMPEKDLDYFVFTLYESYDLKLMLKSAMELDLTASVYDQSGNVLVSTVPKEDGADKIMEGFFESGTYYLSIQDVQGRKSIHPYEVLIQVEDGTHPVISVENIYDEEISPEGISYDDAHISIADSSFFTYDVLRDSEKMGALSYVTEEGNYEVLAEDILGNQTRRRFVLDRDGRLSVAFHTGTEEVLADREIYYNETLDLPAITRAHHKLEGWYTEPSFLNAFRSGREVTRNLDLYAKWTRADYTSVDMIRAPDRLDYYEGEALDLTGLKLIGYFEDGQSEFIDLDQVTVTGYDSSRPASAQEVKLEVDGHVITFQVNILEIQLMSIRIVESPLKTEYVVGQSLDLQGMKVMGTYNNGKEQELPVNSSHITGFSSAEPEQNQIVTVSLEGKTDTFLVNIVKKALVSLRLMSPPEKLEYVEGQKLSLAGISIVGTYNDGMVEEIPVTESQVTGFDSRIAVKEQLVTVTVEGKTLQFTVKILPKVLETIVIRTLPDKLVYEVGESLDLSGLEVSGFYNDGEEKAMNVLMEHISGYSSSEPVKGLKVTITINGADASFMVDIQSRPALDVIEGINRFATASAVSQVSYESSDTAIIVQANNFPDALSAGPLAYALKAPILLTGTASLSKTTSEELKRLGVRKVIILGGLSAVSASVEETLKEAYEVQRIAGSNRYNTAVETARYLEFYDRNTDAVVLASGLSYADALSAGSFASRNNLPILLTKGDQLNIQTVDYLESEQVKQVIVIGGTSVVNEKVVGELEEMGLTVKRVSGASRFTTAVAVGEAYFSEADSAVVANGMDYADALAAAPYAAKMNASILLVEENRISDGLRSHLLASEIRKILVIGGEKAVSVELRRQLLDLLDTKQDQ